MFKNVDKGPSLGLHIVLQGWAISKRGGNIEKKTRYRGQKCRAGLRNALKACFSEKRESPLKLAPKFVLTRCRKALGTTFWSIFKKVLESNPSKSKNSTFNPKNLKKGS